MKQSNFFSLYYLNTQAPLFLALLDSISLLTGRKINKQSKNTFNCFILNLIAFYDEPFEISFNNSYPGYKKDENRNPSHITCKKLLTIRRKLVPLEFIKYTRGKEGEAYSLIEPTDKFREFLSKHNITKENKCTLLSGVIPKDPITQKHEYEFLTKNDLSINCDYKKELNISRKILQEYNKLLAQNTINYPNCEPTLYVRRIFNHQHLPFGGRLYGHWMLIPSEDRAEITINGHKTIELDFSACHLSILATITGKIFKSEDPYDIGVQSQILDNSKIRKIIKAIVVMILNFDPKYTIEDLHTTLTNWLAKQDDIVELASEVSDKPSLVDHILIKLFKAYPWIKSYIGRKAGMQIMYLDSEIAIGVINDFLMQGKIVLTVHDSFVCEEENREFLRNSMSQSFQKVLNTQFCPIINEKAEKTV